MNAKPHVQSRAKILLVEDETHIARPLQFNLEQEGYTVIATPSGREALSLHATSGFDLMILDLMIEEIDGYEVARQVRQRDPRLPIIMLTARSAQQDRIQGLEAGADDYLTKPFHLKELLLRVQRMLQRAGWQKSPRPAAGSIDIAGFAINLETLTGKGVRGDLQLTALEANLLALFAAEPNRVLSRAELLERVWGYHSDVESRTVDNFIARLRKYFEREPDQPRHFISVRGKGYMYVP